jgi:hypothetical protein
MSDRIEVESEVIERLLKAACPERSDDIADYWRKFAPTFSVRPDDVGLAMSARASKVSWMHKTLAHDWVVTFAGMKAYAAYSPHVLFGRITGSLVKEFFDQDEDLARTEAELDNLLYFAKQIGLVKQLDELPWPEDIPQPGTARESLEKVEDKACFDLACMAAAASLFHEMRHVQFAGDGDAPEDGIEEERQCDDFSREMLVASVGEYCKISGYDTVQTLSKRIIALSCTAFTIGVAEAKGMSAAIAGTHPILAERFTHLVLKAEAPEDAFCWEYLACLLIAMLRRDRKMPDAMPFDSPKSLCQELVALL